MAGRSTVSMAGFAAGAVGTAVMVGVTTTLRRASGAGVSDLPVPMLSLGELSSANRHARPNERLHIGQREPATTVWWNQVERTQCATRDIPANRTSRDVENPRDLQVCETHHLCDRRIAIRPVQPLAQVRNLLAHRNLPGTPNRLNTDSHIDPSRSEGRERP